MTWTVDEARGVACPKCGATIGAACTYSGKGSVKAMRIGRSHQERIDVMTPLRRKGWRPDHGSEVIDMDD